MAALDEAPDFDVVVVSVPRHFGGLGDPRDEDLVHEGLTARGVRHLRFGHLDDEDASAALSALDPDIVIRQSQWDADVPAPYRTDALAFTRLAIVPYETMNLVVNVGHEKGRNSAVDSVAHRSAWLVFVANGDMLDAARRDGLFAGAQFRATGHPKADRLRATEPLWPLRVGSGAVHTRVLWSAHHSMGLPHE